jgi:hypothetical protein
MKKHNHYNSYNTFIDKNSVINPSVWNYLIDLIKTPDVWSVFAEKTKVLRDHVPEENRLDILFSQWYNIYLKEWNTEDVPVIAFIAMQTHNDIAHVFRFFVHESYRKQDIHIHQFKNLIQDIRDGHIQIPKKIKVWFGPNETTTPNKNSSRLIADLEKEWLDIDLANHIIHV